MGSVCRVAQNYATRTTFVVFWISPIFRSQTWKSSQPTEIHGEVPVPVVWAQSVRCQIKQLQIDAPTGTTGPNRQQQVPDVCSAAECVPPSLACVATFVSTFHVLHNAPSSTNVIVDVDGLLQGKARQGTISKHYLLLPHSGAGQVSI